jgi:CHAT domain-containing protein
LVALFAAATLTGCRAAPAADPAAIFQDIRRDFLHGNLDVAEQRAEQASMDFSAPSADWPMKFRLLQAEILTYQGRRSKALTLLNDPGVSYPLRGDIAIKRNLLCGLAHAKLGQEEQADFELQEARRLSDVNNSQLIGEVLQADAVVHLYRDQLAAAADQFSRSLKVAREQKDTFLEATDLQNLGYLAIRMEHYDEALALLNEAANFARLVQARQVVEAAVGNMGSAYFYLGDFEKALSNFLQAEQEAKEIGTTSAQVDWLWVAGSAYYNLGDFKKAIDCYQVSLKGARTINDLEEVTAINTELGFLLYRQGQFDSARMHSEEAIRTARMSADKFGDLQARFLEALLAAQAKERDAEQMLMHVHQESSENPSLRPQIESALADFYAGRHQSSKADLWYRKSIRTFEERRAEVKGIELRLPFFANGDVLYRDYADFLIASQKPEEALQLLDTGRAKTLAEALGQASEDLHIRPDHAVDIEAVARKLDATILFYSLGAEKSYLWSITARGVHLSLLPAQEEIKAHVQAYKKAILRSSDPLREANETAQGLYETLVSPAVAMIPKGSRVFIIPDGVLNELNFETLLTSGTSPHYWIEDVTVSNANSIRMLSRIDPDSSPEGTKQLLLIGNPTAAGTGYDSLVNAFAEIRGIEKHFPANSTTVVTQSGAVPAAYAENKPDQFSYIHFVAHGTASRLDPLDSAVVLSPPPQDPDNFKLYARDIMRYPLRARLVTISACYGSGLRAYAGEGLVGLSWAFLRAGSHNVIGALWEISDVSTPLLMDRLYAELQAGNSPDAALRAAKLSLINSPGVYRKPLYWAGFQLYTGS